MAKTGTRSRQVLQSTGVAAFLVGSLTLGRLACEYVPLGVSPTSASQSSRDVSSSAIGISQAGVTPVQPFQPTSALPSPSELEKTFASLATGLVLGAIGAAYVAFAVTIKGIGVPPQPSSSMHAVTEIRQAPGFVALSEQMTKVKTQINGGAFSPEADQTATDTVEKVVTAASQLSGVVSVASVAAEASKKMAAVAPSRVKQASGSAGRAVGASLMERQRRLTMQWKKEDQRRVTMEAGNIQKEIEKKEALLRTASAMVAARRVRPATSTQDRTELRMLLLSGSK
eukprot:TRINITY_DN96918_c0_g1_i1.p1 TRINITY_DN96918_c0_g1~~TRINITY_DN96918_c0_g1_i1.p1  ORF type:complete len:285 (+),score=53.72 TRINITY_DN96918_c0_g1_i1:55-909(+)